MHTHRAAAVDVFGRVAQQVVQDQTQQIGIGCPCQAILHAVIPCDAVAAGRRARVVPGGFDQIVQGDRFVLQFHLLVIQSCQQQQCFDQVLHADIHAHVAPEHLLVVIGVA